MKDPVVHLLTVSNRREAKRELGAIGVDPAGYAYMIPKMSHVLIKIKELDVRAANILKQEMLAKGGEAAVAKWASGFTRPTTDVILMGTARQFQPVLRKMKAQPYGLSGLVGSIKLALDAEASVSKDIVWARHKLPISRRTMVMGILNVTPDSFSERGLYFDAGEAVARAEQMIAEKADIIDVGGESTRPGAQPVPADEEKKRVIPVIKRLAGRFKTPISIDTSKAEVARAAIAAGAAIINDVTALTGDKHMASVCAENGVPVVLMHMRGNPRTMQKNPQYEDLISEIIGYLSGRVKAAEQAGIDTGKILIDPGIGFGKSPAHNLEIIKRLQEFRSLGRPVVLGASRKSMIGEVLGGLPPNERVEGTAATVAAGVQNGADVVRVHDVREMKRVCRVSDAIKRGADWRG